MAVDLVRLIEEANSVRLNRKATRQELDVMLDKMLNWAETMAVVIPEIDQAAVDIQVKIDELQATNELYREIFIKLLYLIDNEPGEVFSELRRLRVEVMGPHPVALIEQ